MENGVVCFYCGTIYDKEEEKCPLCGGKDRIKQEEAPQPVQRHRITEEERRQRRRTSKGGKYAAKKKADEQAKNDSSKPMLIVALVFLALTVLVVTWFIGDMIGWWGGLENRVDRSNGTSNSAQLNEACTYLELSEQTLQLETVGETAQLKLTVNANCGEYVSIQYPDASIVLVEKNEEMEINSEYKTNIWEVTAVAEGETTFGFTCGEFSAICNIIVGEASAPTESTSELPPDTSETTLPDEDFEPELNFAEDITLYQRGETVPLRVENLPDGATVTWRSSDETVAKVDENGIVTAVGSGTATITAEVYGKTVDILVRCPFDESGDVGAHLSHEDVTIRVGESFNLYLLDSDGHRITDVTYKMSEEGICSIEDGKVTGIAGGDYITVTVIYNTKEYKCVVRVTW